MLLRLSIVAICFSAVSLSVIGQSPWDADSKEIERKSKSSNSGDFSFPKDRSASSAVEGSGVGGTGTNSLSAWPGINDDEDDPRGQPEAAAVDGSGAGAVPRRGSIGFDDEEDGDEKAGLISGNVEGSGEGPPAKVYPKVNKNDDADWQTPWEPATNTNDPSTASHPDQKSKSGSGSNDVKPKLDKDDDFILRGTEKKKEEEKVSSGAAAGGEGRKATIGEDVHVVGHGSVNDRPASFFAQPGILAAVIGGVVVGLLCTVLLLMYIVYRMRKMDEGSYPLEEPRKTPSNKQSQEFFA